MATKAQMESELERLTGELAHAQGALALARTQIKELQEPKPPNANLPKTCINCGQGVSPIQATSKGYHCAMCGHEWTDEHEQAPHRQSTQTILERARKERQG